MINNFDKEFFDMLIKANVEFGKFTTFFYIILVTDVMDTKVIKEMVSVCKTPPVVYLIVFYGMILLL